MEKQMRTTKDSHDKRSDELRRARQRLPRAERHAINRTANKSPAAKRPPESNSNDVKRQPDGRRTRTSLLQLGPGRQLYDQIRRQSTESNRSTASSVRSDSVEPEATYKASGKSEHFRRTAYVGMFKAKILVIGPRESGKSVISNFLADATEISGGDYHPTQGVRILEFESSGINVGGGKEVSCEVELWDCSGDQKFENCWPAIQKDANGVLFVFNPDNMSHGKELETLYVHFVQEQGLRDTQCMLFAHQKPGTSQKMRSQLPPYMAKIPCVMTNLEDDSDVVKHKFNDLLAVLLRNWTDRRDQEELSIMNN